MHESRHGTLLALKNQGRLPSGSKNFTIRVMSSLNCRTEKLQPRLGILTNLWLTGLVMAWLPLAIKLNFEPKGEPNIYLSFGIIGVAWGLAAVGGWIATSPPIRAVKLFIAGLCFVGAIVLNVQIRHRFEPNSTSSFLSHEVVLLGSFFALLAVTFRCLPQPMWKVGKDLQNHRKSQFSIRGILLTTFAVAVWIRFALQGGMSGVGGMNDFNWTDMIPLYIVTVISVHAIVWSVFSERMITMTIAAMFAANLLIVLAGRLQEIRNTLPPDVIWLYVSYSLAFTGTLVVSAFMGRMDARQRDKSKLDS